MSIEAMKLALEALDSDNPDIQLRAAITLRQAIEQAEQDHTYGYAKGLAEAIFKKHYASDEHYASGRIVWGVNDTTIGILTQIDNMVAGMVREPAKAEKQEPFAYVYTAPPPRKPLTHPQIHELDWPDGVAFEDILMFARAIEAAHGIKEEV